MASTEASPPEKLPIFVAIGASGSEGLQDIQHLLGALPAHPELIVMVVLHRPSDRISYLAEVLGRSSHMPVLVASEAETMKPGNVYVGEPDGHLALMDTVLAHLVPGAHNRLRNRSIDTLFDSIAVHAGRRAIGIVLSGSLDDGSRGLAAIHAAGGLTMVLEPGNKARGMQQNAIEYDGQISLVGSAAEIAAAIAQVSATWIKSA